LFIQLKWLEWRHTDCKLRLSQVSIQNECTFRTADVSRIRYRLAGLTFVINLAHVVFGLEILIE